MRPSSPALLLLLAACSPKGPGGEPLRDILVVVLDTTSPVVVNEAMPTAQAFLHGGLHFDNAWSAGNSTIEGTGAIFKGAPFWQTEIRALAFPEGLPYRTLPEMLKERGYHTVLASSNPVLDIGFFRLGFDLVWVRHGEDPPPGFTDGATADWFVQAWQRQPQPRFGWIQLVAGHDYWSIGGTRNASTPADEQMKRYYAAHTAEAAMTDAVLPRLLALVPDGEGTVVLTADHGELFGDRGAMLFSGQPTFGHGIASSPMEIHVPLAIRGPGIQPGTVHDVVSNVDVRGSVLAAAGLPQEHDLRSGRNPAAVAVCDVWGMHEGDISVLVEADGSQLVRSDLPTSMGGLPPLLRWTPGQGWQALDPEALAEETRTLLYRTARPICLGLDDICEQLGPIGYISSEACQQAAAARPPAPGGEVPATPAAAPR